MTDYPSVSLIVVNYNGASKFKALLLDCMRSMAKTDYPNYEIVFVDNASGDRSSDMILENFPLPNLRVVRLRANVGYAGAANEGLKVAKGEIIGILNNDLVVTPDWLDPLVEMLSSHPDVAIVSPLLLRDPGTIDSVGGETNVLMVSWDSKSCQPATNIAGTQPIYVSSPPGAAFFFRRELLKELGGRIFDDDFFAYYEDVSLGLQCNLMGHKVAIVPKSRIYHVRGSSWGSISPQKFFLQRRNGIWTGITVLDPFQSLLMLPVWAMSTIYGGVLYYRLTGNPVYVRVSFKVLFSLTSGLKQAWEKHSRFNPKKRISIDSIGLSSVLILDTDKRTLFRRYAVGLVNFAASFAGLRRNQITSFVRYPLLDRIYLAERH
jgi:GT2 family glycosyltransferase